MGNSNIRPADFYWQNRNGYSFLLDSLDSKIAAEEEIPIYLSEIEEGIIDLNEYSEILKFCSEQGTNVALSDTVKDLKEVIATALLFRQASENREFANLIQTANNQYKSWIDLGNGKVAVVDGLIGGR